MIISKPSILLTGASHLEIQENVQIISPISSYITISQFSSKPDIPAIKNSKKPKVMSPKLH